MNLPTRRPVPMRTLTETLELQDDAAHWLWRYNHEQPNMTLSGITLRQQLSAVALLYF